MILEVEGLVTGDSQPHEADQIAVWFAKGAAVEDCCRAFEAYGHAMAAASAFELLMTLIVMKAVSLRLDKRANANIKPADRPQLIRSLGGATFDKLHRELRKSFTLSAELEQGLADGKTTRDHLAHNFWAGHAINLHSSDGIDVIAQACALSANHFRLLTIATIEEAGVDVDDYMEMLLRSPDRGDVLNGWNDLLREEIAKI